MLENSTTYTRGVAWRRAPARLRHRGLRACQIGGGAVASSTSAGAQISQLACSLAGEALQSGPDLGRHALALRAPEGMQEHVQLLLRPAQIGSHLLAPASGPHCSGRLVEAGGELPGDL